MIDKLIKYGIYALMGIGILAVLTWATWGLWHKDVGKQVITTTNAVVTAQATNTAAAVGKKEVDTNGKISTVVRRAAANAGATRADTGGDPGAYERWIDRLCADDVYAGRADCAGHGGQPAGANAAHGGR